MALFSQRKGIRAAVKALQRESIDDDLRNRLWSGLQIAVWNRWSWPKYVGYRTEESQLVEAIVREIWLHYFKQPLDTLPKFNPDGQSSAYAIIRAYFFEREWWEIYDLIEFIVTRTPDGWKEKLKITLNCFLEDENSACRIVGDEVVEITDEHEIAAIETALQQGMKASHTHLSRALDLLSDRRHHDYRNSIKESVSAVEATCQTFAGVPKADLGDCIRVIKERGAIHPAFEKALLKLYGYSSDEGGIRHALTDDSVVPAFSDAKFMLVACSAFVNFIVTKASELGIEAKG